MSDPANTSAAAEGPDPASSIDPRAARLSFDRAATTYDAAAVLQREVGSRMLQRLQYLKIDPGRIADAGCGTGEAFAHLKREFPRARYIGIDFAPSMLHVAREKVLKQRTLGNRISALLDRNASQPSWICADVGQLPFAAASVDLLWSNLTLQWCNQPDAVFREFHRVMKTEALLMFTTLGPDTLRELRQAFSKVDLGTHTSRFIDMHDLGDALVHAGFSDPVMDMETITLTYGDMRTMMGELKSIGAHNAAAGRARSLMGKNRWQALTLELEKYRTGGRLPATFEVIYGHAWKPAPKKTPEGHAIIKVTKPDRGDR